ncbi:uncharacterized protein si:dkey-30j10.5 isoform X1 [Etheostoma spectabile]|uniref:uncharacterized protein si:dkey-30j10.5 isoform X1 n=1 Tax=Etheostoma spectabile TaxID=54343 RepID=UPI0013AE984A|nr:uncharacterized protein LOC116705990 isoform X1 [Etheostoma spectabile]
MQLPTMATSYISDLAVSIDEADENQLISQGFKKINVNLNQGAGGNKIYLWYKNGSEQITRVQFSFNQAMAEGLSIAGFTKIEKNLNAGSGGDYIYLWFSRKSGDYHTPIVEIDVTDNPDGEAFKFTNSWEKSACDLNRKTGGNLIYAWVKREKQTYICDVSATDSYGSDTDYFLEGYIRVDEDTNRGANGAYVFIWYRQTTDPQLALTDLKISTNNDEYDSLQKQAYSIVSVDLNEGTGGNQVYLWYKKQGSNNPIQAMSLLLNLDAVPVYENAGIPVIKKSLNTGNNGRTEYLCFYRPNA